MVCPICDHPYRSQIERALMDGVSLEKIMETYNSDTYSAPEFKFTKDQLRIHSVCHIAMPSQDDVKESIADKLALKEADMLIISCKEYMTTLQHLGSVINTKLSQIQTGEAETRIELTKPMVDLYLGTGAQIRDTVQMMTEAYAEMNADDAQFSRSGLTVLSNALDRSRKEFGKKASNG